MTATIIIATANRPEDLRVTLESWRQGTELPLEIRVVDASTDDATEIVCRHIDPPLKVAYLRAPVKSAAMQRNFGADGCTSDLLIFCDDDVELPPHTLSELVQVFENDAEDAVGGVAGVIEGLHHSVPGRLMRMYYRLQAGYPHEHYGGQFFGAAINILPTDRPQDPQLYPTQWLNSTLAAYRTDLFNREKFPPFHGYSFQEDVNLSSRIGRTHALYFHRAVRYHHKSSSGAHKSNARRLAMMRIIHRWHNAQTLLALNPAQLLKKFSLTVLFESLLLLRGRPRTWREQLGGSWAAWWQLAVLRRPAEKLLEAFSQ